MPLEKNRMRLSNAIRRRLLADIACAALCAAGLALIASLAGPAQAEELGPPQLPHAVGLPITAYVAAQDGIGLEMQFQNAAASGFVIVEYGPAFGALSLARISGTKRFANTASLTVSLDVSRAPLTTAEPPVLTHLRAFEPLGLIEQPARPSLGVEYNFSAQILGNAVFSAHDVVGVSARYADTAADQLVQFDGFRGFQLSEALQLNTRVKLGHRAIVANNGSEYFAIPSVNLTYMRRNALDLEVEIGGRLGTLTNDLATENSREVFMFAGFSKQF